MITCSACTGSPAKYARNARLPPQRTISLPPRNPAVPSFVAARRPPRRNLRPQRRRKQIQRRKVRTKRVVLRLHRQRERTHPRSERGEMWPLLRFALIPLPRSAARAEDAPAGSARHMCPIPAVPPDTPPPAARPAPPESSRAKLVLPRQLAARGQLRPWHDPAVQNLAAQRIPQPVKVRHALGSRRKNQLKA